MEETHISEVVDITEDKPEYDHAARSLLSDKRVLAWIMSRTTTEFRDLPIETIVSCIEGEPLVSTVPVAPGRTNESIIGRDTQDKVPHEGTAYFDIMFHAITPCKKRIKIILNIEAQKNFYPGYDLVTRGIYYGARMLSSQRNREFTGRHYDDLKKVYSIWICMNAPQYLQNTITEYSIQQRKLYGNYSKPARYDLMSVIMLCLGDPEDKDYMSNEYQKLLRLLSVLSSEEMRAHDKLHILSHEYSIATTRNLEEKVNTMCNWSEGVIERVTEKVTAKVTKEVTEQVTQQVTQQVTDAKNIRFVENLMRTMQLATEKACEVLGIQPEDYLEAKRRQASYAE